MCCVVLYFLLCLAVGEEGGWCCGICCDVLSCVTCSVLAWEGGERSVLWDVLRCVVFRDLS